ncbi:hypothetical protein BU17DRAFT_65368 [Hysterangium stoloniferum]|nr:hypothetical protein BU17DRAFT_65368 [Hysterangium stoloniferum]
MALPLPAMIAVCLATKLILYRRITTDSGVWNLPMGFFVIDVSAIGDVSERPTIHPSLLDHFAFSVTLAHSNNSTPSVSPPSPQLRSFPLPSPNPKPPLFPHDKLPSPDVVHASPFIINYTTAILTAARHHPELDGTLLTARCVKDAERLIRASALVFRQDERNTLTEAHVRRVIPPILAHRLRVRDNPREQIMGILSQDAGARNWGKTQLEQTKLNRRSIKAILAEILIEV